MSFSGPKATDYENQGSDAIPFSNGHIEEWTRPPGQHPAADLPAGDPTPRPRPRYDRHRRRAQGLPGFALTPAPWLRTALRLRPGAPLTLEDNRGPALRLICWRTEYERSAYRLPWPRMTRCAVVVRPDLLDVLSQRASAPIVARDLIMRLEAD